MNINNFNEEVKKLGITLTKEQIDMLSQLPRDGQNANYDAVLFCYEGEGTEPIGKVLKTLKQRGNINDVAVIIGSEGGFSPFEANEAISHGFSSIGLGKRILRTETAGLTTLSVLMFHLEG